VLYACIQNLCSTDDDTATCNSPEDSRIKYYLPEIACESGYGDARIQSYKSEICIEMSGHTQTRYSTVLVTCAY
jgi:hypothetical protein